MKKLLAALLAAMLMLCAFSFAEEIDVTGVWYLNRMVYGDQAMGAGELGITMTIVLNEDGTAKMESEAMEVLQDGSWAMNGEGVDLTFDGETETVTIEEGCLVLVDEDEMQMIFSREEPETYTAPEPAAAADISDFDGTWTMVMSGFADDSSRYVPADMMLEEMGFMFGGTEPTLTIENGVVTAFGNEESNTFEFEDGKLVLKLLELEDEAEEEDDFDALLDQSVVMNADGTITYTVFEVQFFCEKAA